MFNIDTAKLLFSFLLRFFPVSVLLFVFSIPVVQANSIPSYRIAADNTHISDFELAYINDAEKNLNVEQIALKKEMAKMHPSRFIVPVGDSNHWFIFTLINDSEKNIRRVVRFDEPYMATADIHYKEDGQWHSEHNGLGQPIGNRRVASRSPSFSIPLAPYESKTIYLKLHSHYYLLTLGILIESPVQFLQSEQLQIGGYLFYIGAAFALILYNLFLLISLRERLYGYYVMHGLCYLTFVIIYSGFDLYLHSSESLHYMLNSAAAMALGFFALFTQRLLQTKRNLPLANNVLTLLAVSFFASAVLIFIDIRTYHVLVMVGMPASLVLLLIGFYALIKGVPLARFYVLGMSWYIIGIFLIASVNFGLVPYSSISRYAYLAGSLIELSILSYALAYRVKLLQAEALTYQQQLTHNEQQATLRLEQQVKERTAELQQANLTLEKQTQIDGLTGLFNRAYFDRTLNTEWQRHVREQMPLCLIMCDIDQFKDYNDTYGHQRGDHCIQAVALSLTEVCQRPADICARYGGEEFVVILPNTCLHDGMRLAETIRLAVRAKNIQHQTQTQKITLSLGVAALIPSRDGKAEELLASADKALYLSKNRGRDQVSTIADQANHESTAVLTGS